MLIFFEANLTLFATPKTGSTAYHMALKKHAEIALVNRTVVKHMNVRDYHNHMVPFLKSVFKIQPDCVAVMRDPIDHMRSWYRYRQRPRLDGRPNSTQGLSFDEFLEAALASSPPAYAKVGYQAKYLSDANGNLGIDHLFAYDRLDKFHTFMERRLGFEFATRPFNQSPDLPAEASSELVQRFYKARPREIELYKRLQEADGHLHKQT